MLEEAALQWRARLPSRSSVPHVSGMSSDHPVPRNVFGTTQFHGPITDLPSLPRYLHLKFGPNQVNVTVVESHNALPICNSEYAIAVVLAHTSVHPNDFGYLGVCLFYCRYINIGSTSLSPRHLARA
jgi:hypothetical protein